ncbi:MAG: radical SAM protein, partial [Dehalococcoidia bacterium]
LLRLPAAEQAALPGFLADEPGAAPSPKTLEQLALGRMLIPDTADELAVLQGRYEASRWDTTSFALTIVTSLGCNFDCPYCFEAKHPSILSPEVEAAVLAVLDDQLPRIQRFSVSWFGGEPLVGKRPLLSLSDAFIARCDRAGVAYSASITTNGYLLDEATCAQLRERRVTSAQVSLDGPPEVHDRMRPLAGGGGSFQRIVQNLKHAVDYLDIGIRMNVDAQNIQRAEELFQILVDEGFAGKLSVYPGQIVGVGENLLAPSASYGPRCLTNREFAWAELAFLALAERYGLAGSALPRPTGAPCTAVRANELVVGSTGELYKCWDSVGTKLEVIGDIRDYQNPNGRLAKWLTYDPFANEECRGCIALPVCMGGCAHHALDLNQYENRCGTFRHTYREQVLRFVEIAEERGVDAATSVAELAHRMETR